jgi:cytochrome c5
MRKGFVWFIGSALLLILSACGLNMSGEPDIESEHSVTLPTQGAGMEANASTPEYFSAGMQIYVSECARCHGAAAGVGPSLADIQDRAGARVEGLSAEDYLHQSIVEPSAYIVEGYADVMPQGYADQYSEDDINNLVRFILDFRPPGSSSAAPTTAASDTTSSVPTDATPAPVAENTDPNAITVHGSLTQGTEGGETIPAGLDLTLHMVNADGTYTEDVATTTSNADGTYAFPNIPRADGGMYLIEVKYQNVVQGGHSNQLQAGATDVDVPLTLYETTTDPSSMMIMGAQILVNYAPINEFGLEVRIDMVVVNTGDRIYASDVLAENGLPVSLEVELPPGAFQVQTNWNEFDMRMKNDTIPVLQDTWPLGPSRQRTVTLFYYLPYDNAAILSHIFSYPVMGAEVLLPNDTVKIESDQFSTDAQYNYRVVSGDMGISAVPLDEGEDIDTATDETLLKSYEMLDPLDANTPVEFTLTGRPTGLPDKDDKGIQRFWPFMFGAGIAMLLLGLIMWWRQRGAAPIPAAVGVPVVMDDHWEAPRSNASKEEILQAIADLDDDFEVGRIDKDTYLRRRNLLKERLLPLLKE